MGPIKFRAWHFNDKKMLEVDELNHIASWRFEWMLWVNGVNRSIWIQWWKHNGCVVMQSTWLLDKNGKEIYEGDIIEENIHFWHLMSYDFVPKYKEEKWSALYQVVRNQERTKFELVYISHKKREPRTKILDIYNAHKIVGNIYENPELINQ